MNNIAALAMRSWEAQKMPSVNKVYPQIIYKAQNIINCEEDAYYLGVKDVDVIPKEIIEKLEEINYLWHTLDSASIKGRAIDINLINPITGKPMTGSSSGSALNVFYGINDIAIGTDGGGSVLGPALSLNLYGFISPLLFQNHMKQFIKNSTDNIEFYPSLGFISKDISLIIECVNHLIPINKSDYTLVACKPLLDLHKEIDPITDNIVELNYIQLDRTGLINTLNNFDFNTQILCSYEGPIDLLGIGDSVFGHYDTLTQSIQNLGHKYLLKVVNMLNLTACVIPSGLHGRGYLLICKSQPDAIGAMLEIARNVKYQRSKLENTYFTLE